MTLTFQVPSASKAFAVLVALIVTLISLSTLGQIAKHVFGHTQLQGFVPLFYVDRESSIPTWYASIMLAIAAGLLLLNAASLRLSGQPFAGRWFILGLVFIGLSADEIAMLHEYSIKPLRDAFNTRGLLHYGWVVFGIAFVAAVTVGFFRPFFSLQRRTQVRLVVAALVYLGGAIGVEMLSGLWADHHGEENLTYALIVTVEEFGEMLGVAILIVTLMDELHSRVGSLTIQWHQDIQPAPMERDLAVYQRKQAAGTTVPAACKFLIKAETA